MVVLVRLAESAGEVVSREDLHKEVWSERFVTDSQVSMAVNEIRTALGDTTDPIRSGREADAATLWQQTIAPLPNRQRFVSDEECQRLLDSGRYEDSLALLGMKDEMYRCLEAVDPRFLLCLYDVDFKPYWHEDRFQSVLDSRKLDGSNIL